MKNSSGDKTLLIVFLTVVGSLLLSAGFASTLEHIRAMAEIAAGCG